MTCLRRSSLAALFLVGCPEGLSSFPEPQPPTGNGACTGLEVPLRGEVATVDPAGVRVAFSVERCDGTPVANLALGEGIEVINNETGRPFGSEGSAVPRVEINDQLASFVILVLDWSDSIASVEERRREVINGARAIVDDLLVEQPNPSLRPYIAVYAFGSTADSRLELDFTRSTDKLIKVLEELRDAPGRGSTNLYGAFRQSLGILRSAGGDLSDEAIVAKSLVILTDGVHETGDAAQGQRAAEMELTEAESADNLESFAIPIQASSDEFDVEAVCALASNRATGCFETDLTGVVEQFRQIAQLLLDRSRSNYIVGICSPVEGPDRKLTIEVTEETRTGALEVDYDATGFRLTGCDPRLVVSCRTGRADCNDDPSDGCETSVGSLAQHDGSFEGDGVGWPIRTSSVGQVAQAIPLGPVPVVLSRVSVRMKSSSPSVGVVVRIHEAELNGAPGRELATQFAQVVGDCSPEEITLDLPTEPVSGRVLVSVEWDLGTTSAGVCTDTDVGVQEASPIYRRSAPTTPELGGWTIFTDVAAALGFDVVASCIP